MPPIEETAHWQFEGPRTWKNYHENFEREVEGVYQLYNADDDDVFKEYVATDKAIQRLIRQAANNGRELRPVGSGWSLSEIAATHGRVVNNKNLKFYFDFEDRRQMDAGFRGDHREIYCFQAGMTVKSISGALDEEGLSISTSGASNGQTIAGALATGTHGAAVQFGSIPEFVVALHLATGGNKSIWLERESDPIVHPEVAESFGARLVRDDDKFNAALVGLGAFGVVLSVTIRAEKRYLLEVHVKKLLRDDALERAMNASDFTGLDMGHRDQAPYNFSMVINPYDAAIAYVTLMYHREYAEPYERGKFDDPDSIISEDAISVIGDLLDAFPGLGEEFLPSTVSCQLESRYKNVEGVYGTHAEVFPATKTRGNISSTAIAVDATNASQALQIFQDVHDSARRPFPGAFGVRFVKGTEATLGFTRFGQTCVLEADGIANETANDFNEALWAAFAESGIEHTMHWGKINNLNEARVREMYGNDRVNSWLAARDELVHERTRSVFSSEFLRRVGLAD